MLVEGRINPPSTRQFVDLSSGSAPLAVQATAAVASTLTRHTTHFSSHCPENDVCTCQRVENDVSPDEDACSRPLPRRTVQLESTRSKSALPVIISTNKSCTRHRRARPSQCHILICKILTFFSSLLSSSSLAWFRQTSLLRTRREHSKECHRGGHPLSLSSHTSLITILSLLGTTLLLLMMGSAVHCSGNPAPSSQHLHSSTHSTSSWPSRAGLVEHAEKLFFGQMGFQRAPTPPPGAKVPQYMMDLYHWFRSNNHDRQMRLAEEEEYDDDRQTSHRPSNAVIALTGEDIAQLSSNEVSVGDEGEQEEEEAKLIAAVNGHHRAPRRRRPSQASRVTLTGAASTVVGHKMNNHDEGKLSTVKPFFQ